MKLAVALLALLLAVPSVVSAETLGVVVARCAPRVAPRTALAIISVESSGKWWAVNDNDRTAPDFATPEAAIAYAERRVAEGGNIDLGLSQLNSSHLAEFHVTVREAFEPCTNVALGMKVLQDAWLQAQARYGNTRDALFHAFEAYNGGAGSWTTANQALRARVDRYASEVWDTAMGLSPKLSVTAAPPAHVAVAPAAVHVHRTARVVTSHRVTVFYRAPKGSGV
jgi:type IV secretion system protein VirB1